MPKVIIIAHNIRSTHNVGAIFRTAEGLGVDGIICSGYTPFPALKSGDPRLPHIREKITKQIHKTALGAEDLVKFCHHSTPPIDELKRIGYTIVGLEQAEGSIRLPDYTPDEKIALVLGEEVDGINAEIIARCDKLVEIPMVGKKESFNVSVAAAMALYQVYFG